MSPILELTLRLMPHSLIIVKPRQPFLDWINQQIYLEDPTESPVTMDYLLEDCTAVLVPEIESLEDLTYLEPLKPLLFEMELYSWYNDEECWPPVRTNQVFDDWFDLEPHSTVYRAAATIPASWRPRKKTRPGRRR
jgi:hypothetical protein